MDSQLIDNLVNGYHRAKYINFIKYCWLYTNRPFLIGYHTKIISDEIDLALKRYKDGQSSYLMFLCCFRSGKTELTSRFLPVRFLAQNPDDEVLIVSHRQDKANQFSRYSQMIASSKNFKKLYPDLAIGKASVQEWGFDNHLGSCQYIGIDTGSAGMGANLLILDDYYGGIEDALSQTIEEKRWNAFSSNLLTRLGSPHIVAICVTPWTTSDIVARIQQEMIKTKDYPQYKILRFPGIDESYPSGYLFPEKYPESWYIAQKATLSKYEFHSLMQAQPLPRDAGVFKTSKIKYYDDISDVIDDPESIIWIRAWDIAASVKELIKSDPDWTVGVKMFVKKYESNVDGYYVHTVYIDDIIRVRFEAPERDRLILSTALAESNTIVGVESFGVQKDVYSNVRKLLQGKRIIRKFPDGKDPRGDLLSRSFALQTACESGNLYVKRADWNEALINELACFPGSKHDDIIAAMVVGFYVGQRSGTGVGVMVDTHSIEVERENKWGVILGQIIDGYEPTISQTDYIRFVRYRLVEHAGKEENSAVVELMNSIIKKLDIEYDYESFKVV